MQKEFQFLSPVGQNLPDSKQKEQHKQKKKKRKNIYKNANHIPILFKK